MNKIVKYNKQNNRFSVGKHKIDQNLHTHSYSSLKQTVLRDRKCSQKLVLANPIQSKKIQIQNKTKSSDYQAFMRKIKKSLSTSELPSSFDLINIDNKIDSMFDCYQDINFKILAHTTEQLAMIATQIISKFGISQICGKYALSKMIKQISNGYNVVSYHNFSHAFSLMHMFYQLVKLDRKFKGLYTKQEIGFTLIAALGHDLNHPGTNNMYEIKMDTELAKVANKESVLEKMHTKTFFNILKTKNITILDKTKNPQKMKELITKAILATDVSRHFKGLQKLKALRQSNQFDPKIQDHRYVVLEQAFHACDIGNPCLQYKEYMNWAALLTYQFNTQTKLQEANKIQVTQMLRYKGKKQFYQGQVGFINALVFPLWKQLSDTWTGFLPYLKNIESNREQLKAQAAKEQS